MECVKKKTIEERIEGSDLRINDININGKEYSLNIENTKNGSALDLKFNKDKHLDDSSPEYRIRIDEKGISFQRNVIRPNHDHDDIQILQVITDPGKTGTGKKGDLVWKKDSPYNHSGYELFYIPFGAIEVNY